MLFHLKHAGRRCRVIQRMQHRLKYPQGSMFQSLWYRQGSHGIDTRGPVSHLLSSLSRDRSGRPHLHSRPGQKRLADALHLQ